MSFIIFIDFDYFYAQVEEIMNPDIRDKPVVVCVYSGRTENSGAVATSNYLARSIGIKFLAVVGFPAFQIEQGMNSLTL